MLTHDRLFVSSMTGADPASRKIPNDPASQVDLALDRVEAVVKAAGLELKNMVFVNPYLTADFPARVMNEHYARRFEFGNTPARATIEVSSLPGGANIEYATSTQHQLRQTMRNLLDNLEEAEMTFDQVVATNVYLDDLSDLPLFDAVYSQYFGSVPPARTTLQQITPTVRKPDKEDHFPGLEQVSLIAVRSRK
jgi:enamine deaminase RidA (YjgF/YER057c/UK114 family)